MDREWSAVAMVPVRLKGEGDELCGSVPVECASRKCVFMMHGSLRDAAKHEREDRLLRPRSTIKDSVGT
jgi:hypothetical protein